MTFADSFRCRVPLPGHPVDQVSLRVAERHGAGPISRLPWSLRALLEHLLRHEDGATVTAADVQAVTARATGRSVPFRAGRVLLQDSSGIPVLADLVSLREAVVRGGGSAARAEPVLPMDLVVDHAVEADHWGRPGVAALNLGREMERHRDRYRFLRWAQSRLDGLHVVPPGVGICHQLNLEVLSHVVTISAPPAGRPLAGLDSLVGTDSHTTMVNALPVLGWGVGGIEATAAILGEPLHVPVPEVVGVRLRGCLGEGVLASDLALTLTEVLREHGVVQRFVEFCGPGVAALSLPDRATVSNMAPEYGATVSLFPPDRATLDYLRATGRSASRVAFVESYLRAQGLFGVDAGQAPEFDEVVDFDLATVRPSLAGPSRPDQRLGFADVAATVPQRTGREGLDHGDLVLAAITSCTNTSNPRALAVAGLLAREAVRRGLVVPARVKTTFAPGSRTASELLARSGLQPWLDQLGFHVAGHGCMTCMGNSGPLDAAVEQQLAHEDLSVAAVLSGNRNFEGRVHPLCRLAYLASPPLVVAFALAGRMDLDLYSDPIGVAEDGSPVRLRDLWPDAATVDHVLAGDDPADRRSAVVATPDPAWQELDDPGTDSFSWDGPGGFIRRPPFLDGDLAAPQLSGPILGARALLVLGDGVTTDHISPVARVTPESAAGAWLRAQGVEPRDHASFSARRLNHDVMLRGGFANPRLRNLVAPDAGGGMTRLMPEGTLLPVHEAAALYRERGVPLVVVAGDRYGAGSARDWAAKVTRLLGVRVVLARSFERIHRTNLLAMGVLPLILPRNVDPQLDGTETFDLPDVAAATRRGGRCHVRIFRPGAELEEVVTESAVLTSAEESWLQAGGLLPHLVGRALAAP